MEKPPTSINIFSGLNNDDWIFLHHIQIDVCNIFTQKPHIIDNDLQISWKPSFFPQINFLHVYWKHNSISDTRENQGVWINGG